MPHFLTDDQFRTLSAICDTLIPALARDANTDPYGFWARSASAYDIPRHVTKRVRDFLDPDQQQQFRRILDGLTRPHTAGLLTGHFRPFAGLPLAAREKVLQSWAVSPRPELRQLFQSFRRLTGALFYSLPDASGCNPNWPALGYDSSRPPARGIERGSSIRPLAIEQDTTFDCDVVVVGSGAGGGVVAGELARAGKDVIVLEKGGYYTEHDFEGGEYSALQKLYENTTTADGGVVVLAGSNLGGGTTINWAASFRTPEHVLHEWEHEHLCPGLTGPEFQASLDAVCARLHVD
ncbi:MAG: GMC family oxidoreductase N-terminal domain-containing protein, partial [Anaerolineales bacterium]